MARRFRSGRGRRVRRSVAWIPGFNTYDTVAQSRARGVDLNPIVTGSNTFGAAISLTTDTDLTLHGGEDAVLTRIRGKLFFSDGSQDTGSGGAVASFQVRVVITVADFTEAGTTTPFDYTTSAGLGNDNILWYSDVIVPSTQTSGVGTGMDNIDWNGRSLDIDVKAKRRIQSDRHIILWFQTVGVTNQVDGDFVLRGGLRMLLMTPKR